MVDVFDGEVLPLQNAGKAALQVFGVQKLSGLDGLFLIFVAVDRSNAPLGGAVGTILQTGLLQGVQVPVVGEHQGGAVGDLKVFGSDLDARLLQVLDLLPQMLTVDDHTVAQDIDNALAEDAGGQQVQGEFSVFVDDGVTGVVAALVAHHHVVLFGDQVHHAALAFVTPVDAHDRAVRHKNCLLYGNLDCQKPIL